MGDKLMGEICFTVIETTYGFILDWRIWAILASGGIMGIVSSWLAIQIGKFKVVKK